MSMFEIIRGVEGNCLVLDGTRICGPKPWGGGRIIKTFHTDGIYEVINKKEHHKLLEDNTKLRELCSELLRMAESNDPEWIHWPELHDELRKLGVEVSDA